MCLYNSDLNLRPCFTSSTSESSGGGRFQHFEKESKDTLDQFILQNTLPLQILVSSSVSLSTINVWSLFKLLFSSILGLNILKSYLKTIHVIQGENNHWSIWIVTLNLVILQTGVLAFNCCTFAQIIKIYNHIQIIDKRIKQVKTYKTLSTVRKNGGRLQGLFPRTCMFQTCVHWW